MLLMRPIRIMKDLPLYELARRTGISPSKLSLIERELVFATPNERGRIARSLGIKAQELFQTARADTLIGYGENDDA